MRHYPRLLLFPLALLACAFAPVPPPRTGVADAVVNGFGAKATAVRRQLLQTALPLALNSPQVKGLACLRGEGNPSEWLASRLKTEDVAPDGAVRVQLTGCQPKEALALLTALTDAYGSRRRFRQVDEQIEMLALVQVQAQIQQQGGGVPLVLEMPTTRRRQGPAILQRPKLVSSDTAR